jgi:4-hydroxyphenylpyruvate dioxygenase
MSVRALGSLELWVGNARQAAHFFTSAFGFSLVAYAGPETGLVDRSSYVLKQGDALLIVTGASTRDSEVAEFVHAHGDGVRDISIVVDDVAESLAAMVQAGARSVTSFGDQPDRDIATVATFGDLVHTLTLAGESAHPAIFDNALLPAGAPSVPTGLLAFDHYAIGIEAGQRERWVNFYERTLGFERVAGDPYVELEQSAFTMTTVRVPDSDGAFVLAEPSSTKPSQISDFLATFVGPGIHHIALSTHDIADTMSRLRTRGVQTLGVPDTYYEEAQDRVGDIELAPTWQEFAKLGVMVDRDDEGYLLQAFTKPLGDRATTYLEIIQRVGTRGFGNNNIRDLYSTVVREQQRRVTSQP